MGAKIQAFDIFQTPLSSHYPLSPVRQSLCWQIANPHIKNPQIQKDSGLLIENPHMTHFRRVRKSNKLFKSENLRICDLRNFIADRPPLKQMHSDLGLVKSDKFFLSIFV